MSYRPAPCDVLSNMQLRNEMHSDQFQIVIHFNGCFFTCRSIISFFPYFTWLILIITLSTIAVQIAELDIPKINVTYVWLTDIVFIIATLTELILKVAYD